MASFTFSIVDQKQMKQKLTRIIQDLNQALKQEKQVSNHHLETISHLNQKLSSMQMVLNRMQQQHAETQVYRSQIFLFF